MMPKGELCFCWSLGLLVGDGGVCVKGRIYFKWLFRNPFMVFVVLGAKAIVICSVVQDH